MTRRDFAICMRITLYNSLQVKIEWHLPLEGCRDSLLIGIWLGWGRLVGDDISPSSAGGLSMALASSTCTSYSESQALSKYKEPDLILHRYWEFEVHRLITTKKKKNWYTVLVSTRQLHSLKWNILNHWKAIVGYDGGNCFRPGMSQNVTSDKKTFHT